MFLKTKEDDLSNSATTYLLLPFRFFTAVTLFNKGLQTAQET